MNTRSGTEVILMPISLAHAFRATLLCMYSSLISGFNDNAATLKLLCHRLGLKEDYHMYKSLHVVPNK